MPEGKKYEGCARIFSGDLQPKSFALQNLRVIEGSVFDMGDVNNGDQGVIAFANTGKN